MDLGAGHGSSGEDSSYSASEDDDTEMPEEDGGFLASSVSYNKINLLNEVEGRP